MMRLWPNKDVTLIATGTNGVGLWSQAFLVQVWNQGSASWENILNPYLVNAESSVATGGWWSATARNAYVKFAEVESYAVRFVQAPGGGSVTDPNRAWLNEMKVLNKKWQEVKFWYDALGRRIGKRVFSPSQGLDSLTRWLYDGQQILEEKLGGQFGGTIVSEFRAKEWVYGTGIDEPIEMVLSPIPVPPPDPALPPDQPANFFWPNAPSGGRFTYHTNSLGSVTALTSSSGQLVERYSYTVYGEVTFRDASGNLLTDPLTNYDTARRSLIGNPYLFTGREWDSDVEVYHFRARAYAPCSGRFLQRDPSLYKDGPSFYEYCHSSPVVWLDLLGTSGVHSLEDFVKEAKKIGLPTKYLDKALPTVKRLEFTHVPGKESQFDNGIVSINDSDNSLTEKDEEENEKLKPFDKLTGKQVGTICHEMWHAYFKYVSTLWATRGWFDKDEASDWGQYKKFEKLACKNFKGEKVSESLFTTRWLTVAEEASADFVGSTIGVLAEVVQDVRQVSGRAAREAAIQKKWQPRFDVSLDTQKYTGYYYGIKGQVMYVDVPLSDELKDHLRAWIFEDMPKTLEKVPAVLQLLEE